MEMEKFEVIIVGGSYSGLAAAMALGRSRRKVLVVDSGLPCNRFTPHSQNFLTWDGAAPAEIAAIAKSQVQKYPTIHFLDDLVVSTRKATTFFEVQTADGKAFSTEVVVLATGIKDLFPEVEGFADCWGKSVIHCPYCHGYEFRDQKTAIWVRPGHGLHLAPLVRNLTEDLTLLTNDEVHFDAAEQELLAGNGIAIIDDRITRFIHQDGQLNSVCFENGREIDFKAVYAGLPFEQHSSLAADLGCEFTDTGHIQTDPFFKTSVEGLYACGDNVSPLRSVASAVSNGTIAAAGINRELAILTFEKRRA